MAIPGNSLDILKKDSFLIIFFKVMLMKYEPICVLKLSLNSGPLETIATTFHIGGQLRVYRGE